MHLYFLLKAFLMIMTMVVYITYSYYSNVYRLIGDNYGLNGTGVLLETTFGMIMFILLLIALDRRVTSRIRRERNGTVR